MSVYICRAGMDLATVQVRMDNLKIEADIAVGSRGNPSVTNTFRNLAEVSLPEKHITKLDRGVSHHLNVRCAAGNH